MATTVPKSMGPNCMLANSIVSAIRLGTYDCNWPVGFLNNVDESDINGNTALHLAVIHGRVSWVIALLRAGASPVVKNRRGRRPVDIEGSLPIIVTMLTYATAAQPYVAVASM